VPLVIRQRRPGFFEGETMLRFAIVFLVIALIAGLFGYGFVESAFMEGAKILFFVFIVLAVLSLLAGAFRNRAA
jgi:uncharacterized membrane protein YtjA (UPF0391 family)